jgi:CheY-like chemotaxis protein
VVFGAETSVRPLRVLLVDDHPAIREIVSAYLAEDRHVVATAGNAKEAMERFCTERFDLVITDRAMPEVNGDELAGMIKELQPRKPVIMLTGFADVLLEGNHSPENVDLVLSKPARLDDLRKAITAVMSREPCPAQKCDPVLLSAKASK